MVLQKKHNKNVFKSNKMEEKSVTTKNNQIDIKCNKFHNCGSA